MQLPRFIDMYLCCLQVLYITKNCTSRMIFVGSAERHQSGTSKATSNSKYRSNRSIVLVPCLSGVIANEKKIYFKYVKVMNWALFLGLDLQ